MKTVTEQSLPEFEPRPQSGARPVAAGPPPPSPFAAVRRHPFLTLLPILLAVAAAVAISITREPQWSSEARISVGELNPSAQTAPGIVEANQQLASAYSRAVTAKAVVDPAAKKVGVTGAVLAGRVSATPVAESPILVVKGKGTTEQGAVRATTAITDSLIAYVRALGNQQGRADELLGRLRDAQQKALAAHTAATDAKGTPNEASRQADVDSADLRASALRRDYLAQTESSGATPVAVINPAEQGTSDRKKFLKLAVVIALLAGIAVGVALATLRATTRHRKRFPPELDPYA